MTRAEAITKANEVIEIFALWGINRTDCIHIAREMLTILATNRQARDTASGNVKEVTKPTRN